MAETNFEQTLADIGERLKALRKKKGYSSHESFAFDYDLPRVQYWRLENGKANCTLKSLYKILAIHNVTIESFFGEHGNGQQNL